MKRKATKKLFGYKCPECGIGTVQPKEISNYKTKVDNRPFVVPKAVIGVCDACWTRNFSAKERIRWDKLYKKQAPKLSKREKIIEKLIYYAEIIEIDQSNGLWQLKRFIKELKKQK